jgi:hypothetical protein
MSCAFGTTCHGDLNRPKADLYLGANDRPQEALSENDINAIHTHLVGKASAAAPSIPLVDPGKPETSFLMMKLDGCLDEVRGQCQGTSSQVDREHPCGSSMPESSDLLPKAERDLIRSWIAQGAPNN